MFYKSLFFSIIIGSDQIDSSGLLGSGKRKLISLTESGKNYIDSLGGDY